jgi:subtilisin family serine protease
MFKKIYLTLALIIATISTPIYAQSGSSSSQSSNSSEASSSLNSSSVSSQSSSNSSLENQNSSTSSSFSSISNEELVAQTKNDEPKEVPKVDLKPTATKKRQLLVSLKTQKTNKDLENSLTKKDPNKPSPIKSNSDEQPAQASNLLLVEVKAGENLNDTAQKLKDLPEVESVQTNNPYQFDSLTPNTNPNYTSDQWYLKNSNTNPMGTYAQSAWSTVATALGNTNSGGSSSVKIAVIDSGVNTTLADFAGINVANPSRFFSKPSTCNPLVGEIFLAGPFEGNYYICRQDGSQYDETGHGTAVAGVIYMQNNSTQGVGIAHQTTLMPIALHGDAFSTYGVAKAIRYAVDNGAKVINLSLGTPFNDIPVQTEINYAISQGVSVVASAGNCGNKTGAQCYPFLTPADPEYYVPSNIVSYPAAYPDVIAVGAVNANGTKSSYSTAASYVDLVAPVGETGVSGGAVYTLCGKVDYVDSNGAGNPCTGKTLGDGSFWTGTSFAAPEVAGAIGLLRSKNDGLDSFAIRYLLTRSSSDFYGYSFNNNTGWGPLKIDEVVKLSILNQFGSSGPSGGWSDNNIYPRMVGDMNNDGRTDIIGFGYGGVQVSYQNVNGTFAGAVNSTGQFGRSPDSGNWSNFRKYPRFVKDMNNDGKVDVIGFYYTGIIIKNY